MYRSLFVALIAVVLVAADDSKKDADKMQGTWSVVIAEKGGKQAPEEAIKNMKVVVNDDSITIQDGKRDEKVTFKLDSSKKPKAIDFKPHEPGSTKDPKAADSKPHLGIYELDGDNLKFCWRKSGGDRPTEFASEAGSNVMIMVLKREKK